MEFNFQGIPQQAYLTMLIIFILLHYGKTVSACETEQRDENIKKKMQYQRCWVTRITIKIIISKDRYWHSICYDTSFYV